MNLRPLYVRQLGASGTRRDGTPWRTVFATPSKDCPIGCKKNGATLRTVAILGPLAETVQLGDLISVESPR